MNATLHTLVRPYGRGWMIATESDPPDAGGDAIAARRAELHPERFRCWTGHGWGPQTAVPMFFPTERDATEYLNLNRDRM